MSKPEFLIFMFAGIAIGIGVSGIAYCVFLIHDGLRGGSENEDSEAKEE